MDLNSKDLCRRWKAIKEQLITIWAFHRGSPVAVEFSSFLNEEFPMSTLNMSDFNHICYFLLGLINREERDRLIKWPIVNINGQVKFRKGLFAIVNDLIEKYPQMNFKQLPESYMLNPSFNQKKILEFILKLSNLAVYLSVDDPCLLMMKTKFESVDEIRDSKKMIKRARINEEKTIEEKKFPLEKFEEIRMDITSKCVALKKENLSLNKTLKSLVIKYRESGLVHAEEDCDAAHLKEIHDEKLEEVCEINKELKKYSDLGEAVVDIVKSSGEPNCLSAEDLGFGKEDTNWAAVTEDAFERLSTAFDRVQCKDASPEEKEQFLKSLEGVRHALLKEREASRGQRARMKCSRKTCKANASAATVCNFSFC